MQLHVSVMFNMHKKWSGSVVYAATETRVSRLNMFLPRFRLRILAISSCVCVKSNGLQHGSVKNGAAIPYM